VVVPLIHVPIYDDTSLLSNRGGRMYANLSVGTVAGCVSVESDVY
jgi:hypothetical protein